MEVWEKQAGEGGRVYEYFCAYRDMGPGRSLAKLWRELGKKPSLTRLEDLSVRHGWVKRAEAYDLYLDSLRRQEQEEAIRAMARRHAELAVAFLEKVAERLEAINPEELKPADLIRWLAEAVKVERLARGEPTEIQSTEINLPPILEVETGPDANNGRSSGL